MDLYFFNYWIFYDDTITTFIITLIGTCFIKYIQILSIFSKVTPFWRNHLNNSTTTQLNPASIFLGSCARPKWCHYPKMTNYNTCKCAGHQALYYTNSQTYSEHTCISYTRSFSSHKHTRTHTHAHTHTCTHVNSYSHITYSEFNVNMIFLETMKIKLPH